MTRFARDIKFFAYGWIACMAGCSAGLVIGLAFGWWCS